jgi:copper transport protein
VLRAIAVAVGFGLTFSTTVLGHAGLRISSPLDGVSLGDAPTAISLTFTETPEPSLSEIHVSDRTGVRYEVGRPVPAVDDPRLLAVDVRPLPTGVYTVAWRIVSSVDGHATTGAYAFGVRTVPEGLARPMQTARFAPLEISARWIFACGLVLLVGAASGYTAGFGGPRDLAIARVGLLVSAAGTGLLALAQLRSGGISLSALLTTSIGRALAWRAAAIAVGGVALSVAYSSARRSERRVQMGAMIAAGSAALAAMAIHVMSGHAAADAQPVLEAAVQWMHFAACGIWIGGLVSLLIGLDHPWSSTARTSARRFSAVAAGAICLVLATGLLRTFHEMVSWSDFVTSGYGRVLVVKIAFFTIVAAFGAFNRWRSLPMVETKPALLRQFGRAELACATAALTAAAILGTLVPPVATRPTPGIVASGVDFGTTVRAALSAVSDQPGPNRFAVRVADYDSRKPVRADRVGLRFRSVDDPDLPSSSLPLTLDAGGLYAGSGANLSLDGRWNVTVTIEREGNSVDVPLDIAVRGRAQPVEVWRSPSGIVRYTVEIRNAGVLRFEIDPRHVGRTRLEVSCLDFILDERRLSHMAVTLANANGPERELPLQPLGRSRFASDVDLAAGSNVLAAVARTLDGIRMRAVIQIDVPRH